MKNPISKRMYVHQFKEPARVDPTRSKTKIAGSPECPICHAVSVKGRWVAQKSEMKLAPLQKDMKCPACLQKEQRFALGVIEVRGEHWKEQEEIVKNTIKNTEKIARHRNDQQRVLWTEKLKGVFKIYVTLPELARSIGRELEKSFHGVVEYEKSTQGPYMRVLWWTDLPHVGHQNGAPLGVKKKRQSPVGDSHKSKLFRKRGQAA